MRHELFQQMQYLSIAMAEPTQQAYWSPLSPVANEVWAFWEPSECWYVLHPT
jgi:hypothetical protein